MQGESVGEQGILKFKYSTICIIKHESSKQELIKMPAKVRENQ